MSIEEVYKQLQQQAKAHFEAFDNYVLEEMKKGYLKKDVSPEPDELKFGLGQRKFLLVASMQPQIGCIYYRTYELVRNEQSYPNWRTELLEDLDMVYILNDPELQNIPNAEVIRFVNPMTFVDKASLGENISTTKLMYNFPADYFQQLMQIVHK